VLDLGTLNPPRERWNDLANRIEELVIGRGPRLVPLPEEIELLAVTYAQRIQQKKRKDQETAIHPTEQDFQSVDINSIETEKPRSIGAEHAGLAAMEALGFGEIFKKLDFSKTETDLAKLLNVGRLVHPSSERELKTTQRATAPLICCWGQTFLILDKMHSTGLQIYCSVKLGRSPKLTHLCLQELTLWLRRG